MSELQFRIVGVTDERIRWERRFRQRPRPPLLLVAGLAVLGTVYLGAGEPGEGQWHVVLLHATEVRANRVIVLIDDSGSTAGTEPAVQFQLNRLAAADPVPDRPAVPRRPGGVVHDPRPGVVAAGAEVSRGHRLQDRVIERLIGHQPLQPGVLLLEGLQSLGLVKAEAAVLFAPPVVRLLADNRFLQICGGRRPRLNSTAA